MVGMAGENGQTAIELLEHEHPHELMGKRQRPERNHKLRPGAHRGIEAVGAPSVYLWIALGCLLVLGALHVRAEVAR